MPIKEKVQRMMTGRAPIVRAAAVVGMPAMAAAMWGIRALIEGTQPYYNWAKDVSQARWKSIEQQTALVDEMSAEVNAQCSGLPDPQFIDCFLNASAGVPERMETIKKEEEEEVERAGQMLDWQVHGRRNRTLKAVGVWFAEQNGYPQFEFERNPVPYPVRAK